MNHRGALLKPSEKGERRPSVSRSIAKGSRYEVLKQEIRGWWEDRFKVGEYLKEIRDGKLYKEEYTTFEEFSEAEFEIKRSYAHRLIEAADVKESVKTLPIGNKLTHESQARALAPVPVEKREEVLTKTSERGPVTARTITETAKQIAAPKPDKHLDKTGYPIPDEILSDWRTAESFSETLNQLHRIKLRIQKALEDSELAFREITNSSVSELESAWGDLQRVLPYVVCPTCQGRTREKCQLCKQRGWISKFGYEHWVSRATREIREKAIKK